MTGTGAVLKLGRPQAPDRRRLAARPAPTGQGAVVGLEFEGANPDPAVAGKGRLEGVSNYLLGSDPDRWFTGVPTYSRVHYRDLYDGVDLEYYANRAGGLEFDLTLAPGADPAGIRLAYSGADRLEVDGAGALVLEAGGERLRQAPPVVYQWVDGARREVPGRYVLHGDHRVGFALAGYDRTVPLVIDPVITYSTYLGGSGDDNPIWSDVDRAGSFYVTGSTTSTDFPTTPRAFQPGFGGEEDAFVTKLNRSGSGLVWSTYLGGDGPDAAIGLDVDRHGNVVVTGVTSSVGFPTTPGAIQAGYGGGPTDAFLVLLGRDGSRLRFGSYLGGGGEDGSAGAGSWLDGKGNWFVPGFTDSTDFPVTAGAFQAENAGGVDVFLVKVALGKRHGGAGQRTASVTAAGRPAPAPPAEARAGLTRDRMAGRR